MQRSRKVVAVVVLGLTMLMAGCNDGDVRKAARAADSIASGLAAVQKANEAVFDAGLIDKEDAKAVSLLVKDATLANDVFVAKVRTLKEIDPSSKVALVRWFGELSASIEKLNQEGVLRVKNPEAKAKLSVAFAAVQAGLDIIGGLLQSSSSNGQTPFPDTEVKPVDVKVTRVLPCLTPSCIGGCSLGTISVSSEECHSRREKSEVQ